MGHRGVTIVLIFSFLKNELRARAKGAEKASCGETVIQEGVFGESVSFLPPEGLLLNHLKGPENLKVAEKKRTLQKRPFGQLFLRTTPLQNPRTPEGFQKRFQKGSLKCFRSVFEGF